MPGNRASSEARFTAAKREANSGVHVAGPALRGAGASA